MKYLFSVLWMETWLHSNIPNAELFFQNFKIFRLDRPKKRGGGLITLVSNQLSSHLENTLVLDHIELIHISVDRMFLPPTQLISPSSDMNLFFNYLRTFLNCINYYTVPCLIVGDFNVDVSKSTQSSKSFKDFLKTFNLHLINKKSTTQ